MAHDLTIDILKQIRGELVTTRTMLGESIAQTNPRLDQTNHRRLEEDMDALRARVDKIEARLG